MVGVKAIVPKKPVFDVKRMERAIDNDLDKVARGMKKDFEATTRTWTEAPVFKIVKGRGSRTVRTTDQVYHWVNFGTRPHVIRVRVKKALAWRYPYRHKSVLTRIGSRAGYTGKQTRFAKEVQHPGIRPRRYDLKIAKKWQKAFPPDMQRAINDAL